MERINRIEKGCFIVVAFYLTCAYALFLFKSPDTITPLLTDNGVVDWSGALCFLAASLVFALSYLKDTQGNDLYFFKTKKNIFFLLFAVAFFIAFGEEIDWLQRLFHVKTNELLLQYNIQKEINFHNLKVFYTKKANGGLVKSFYSIDMLFTVFWMTYCLILPVLSKYLSPISNKIKKINIPMVPLWLSVLFLLNYLYYRFVVLSLPLIIEFKEANVSLLFAILSIFLLLKKYSRESLPIKP